MFGQVQGQLPTDRVNCHFPKRVSCDGIDLAHGGAFYHSRLHAVRGCGWRQSLALLIARVGQYYIRASDSAVKRSRSSKAASGHIVKRNRIESGAPNATGKAADEIRVNTTAKNEA